MKILFTAPGFFHIPMRSVSIETWPGSGRTYFVYRDRIVAVATLSGEDKPCA